ncbi:MAG: YHS domain-containing (seleno)protein [Cyanobacteria bacterium P01_A01_bin.84]
MKQICSLILFLLFGAQSQKLSAQNPVGNDPETFVNVDSDGVILKGYDAVAFFIESKPVKGKKSISSTYKEAIYNFSTQENKKLFDENPERYKVHFGGWCAYAVSLGRIAPITIETWSIVDGSLVIQHNQRAVKGWEKDPLGNLKKANLYWPKVASNNGKQIKTNEEKAFLNNIIQNDLILQGYDAVAYVNENRATKGDSQFKARYQGANYWFKNETNLNLFKDNPSMFAPEYGGFCGYAMSRNKLRPIDPNLFQIIDGRLILQHSQKAYKLFNQDLDGNIKKADKFWPKKVRKKAGKKVKFDSPANSK